jgi:hypothetical protein
MGSVEQGDADEVCASCGKAAVDDVKLKKCACDLVKYCGVECQKNHRPQHKKACKKRMAEIRDDRLFTLPDESHFGECPICCLPLPIDRDKSFKNTCCSKGICKGCSYANQKREQEQGLRPKCPYCREPVPTTDEEIEQNDIKRVKANDPAALCDIGKRVYLEGDYDGAVQYLTKAAALLEIEAHYQLAMLYRNGHGVEKSKKKEMYHLEEAAIGGHPEARYNLGAYEMMSGRIKRGVKHLVIAAKLGDHDALEAVKDEFARGNASKEDYEAALRGHQAAVDATKSQKRTEAEAYFANNAGN